MNGVPISWKSRRQDSVALSTSEAEYVSVSEVDQEILYLRVILRDVGRSKTAPTNIYEDNLTCIAMSTNHVHRKSSRHIDIQRKPDLRMSRQFCYECFLSHLHFFEGMHGPAVHQMPTVGT